MGITLIRKPNLRRRKGDARIALVLSGGAISGGAFKIGGLIALNNYLQNINVTHFNTYIGLSAGAVLAAPLAAGVAPEELLKSLAGTSNQLTRFQMLDFYYPNWSEFLNKPTKLSKDVALFGPDITWAALRHIRRHRREVLGSLRQLLKHPNLLNLELLALPIIRTVLDSTDLPYGSSYLPAGLFDNRRLERFVRLNFERNRIPNNFRLLQADRGKSLYIVATDADTAEEVVFGPDEVHNVTISEAVQASSALPIFFKPARIGGHDYLDAGLLKTANVRLALRKEADLIIVYNPFRPWTFTRESTIGRHFEHLSDLGLFTVINQSIRAMLHSRLHIALRGIANDPACRGDIICIEPAETDQKFFSINPIAFWKRAEAAQHGFVSTRRSIEKRHPELAEVFGHYGIEVDLGPLRKAHKKMQEAAKDDSTILSILERRTIARRSTLRVVREDLSSVG